MDVEGGVDKNVPMRVAVDTLYAGVPDLSSTTGGCDVWITS